MSTLNTQPLFVDFNSRDEDGAVWLSGSRVLEDIEKMGLNLLEGGSLWLTDGEVELTGKLAYRVDRWVVIPDEAGFKVVRKASRED